MNSKDFLLKICPTWHSMIASIAENQHLTMSQVMRNALQTQLGLPETQMEQTYRARPITKPIKKPKQESETTRVTLAADLPRYMDVVLKSVAKQKNWSVSSLVCIILYKKINPMPSRPVVSPFVEGMVKRIPLNVAPSKYYLRASVPKDWMPVIQEYADANGQKVGHVVRDILMESLGSLKESAMAEYEKAQQS